MEEKTFYGDSIVYLSFIHADKAQLIDKKLVSSVHCFPLKNNSVLFTLNPRGIDIIGGHVDDGETPEQAMRREAMEEGCIKINAMRIIGAIQVDNRDNPKAIELGYSPIGYQLFYMVDNYEELPFVIEHECSGRQYVDFDEISRTHHKWLETHQKLVDSIRESLIN